MIRDVYPGSGYRFFHPGSRILWPKSRPNPGPGSATLPESQQYCCFTVRISFPGYNQLNYFILKRDKEDVESLFNCNLTV
jgi:hypothetical protein